MTGRARPTVADDLATLRERLNYICADSLDIPHTFGDGSPALDVQTAEMGEVSAWFAEVRDALARVEAEIGRLEGLEAELRENDRLLESAWAARDRETEKAQTAEAEIARLEQDNEVLRELPSREIVRRAEAAEDRYQRCTEDMGRFMAEVARLRDGLRRIQEIQPNRIEWYRKNEIVFQRAPGCAPTEWEAVAFWTYTDLCEIESIARALLDEDGATYVCPNCGRRLSTEPCLACAMPPNGAT